jgi:hypothetical protein
MALTRKGLQENNGPHPDPLPEGEGTLVTSMGSARKQTSEPVSLLRLLSWLVGPGRSATVIVVLVGALAGGAWWAWQKYQPWKSSEYRLDPDRVEIIAPKSDWIHCDIRGEVFRHPTLDGPASMLDDDIVERIRKAFESHPWVAKVESVVKRYGKVRVTLTYRQPVCMVGTAGGLLPLDASGVLLPNGDGDFSSKERARYPCLTGVAGEPPGPAGTRWSDARVVGGAEIAAALGQFWESMRLYTITPSLVGGSPEPSFVLETHGGTRVVWGAAPGAAPALGEPTAAQKVVWLRQYVFEHDDTLDGPQGRPQEIDLRHWPPVVGPRQ